MKKPNRFYAAENRAGTRSSIGFSKDWYVLVFDSRDSRDKWLQSQSTLSSRKITRRDVSKFTPHPSYDTHGSHLAIIKTNIEAEGLIGTLDRCWPDEVDEFYYVERFEL